MCQAGIDAANLIVARWFNNIMPTIQLASWRVTSTVSPGIGTVKAVVVGE